MIITKKVIELDGSWGEGGGSLIRTALALSTLTGQAFSVTHIRAGRPQPGLKAQHLEAINALKQLCSAETNDITIGSTELTYTPQALTPGKYTIDIGTAGSISLALQALLLPCMFAPGTITLQVRGGTCGRWQASVDYLQNLLLPQLQRFAKLELKILRRGYYPQGGGEVTLKICPSFRVEDIQTMKPLQLIQQTKDQIKGVINVSLELQEKEVGERIAQAAESSLKNLGLPISLRVEYARSLSVGGECLLWCGAVAGSSLVEKQKSSEQIGREAAEALVKELRSGAVVDYNLADQLMMFMALLPESELMTSSVTNHTTTNIYVIEKFLGVKFEINGTLIGVHKSASASH